MSYPLCKICSHATRVITIPYSGIKYYACPSCDFIFIDEDNILSKEDEERRYRQHDNTLENEGYAERYEVWRPVALLHIKELVAIGTTAMKARGKKLLTKLNQLTTA